MQKYNFDWKIKLFLGLMSRQPPITVASLPKLRDESRTKLLNRYMFKQFSIEHIENRSIPGRGGDIPVRIYHPAAKSGTLPLIVYFHGGGWVFGGLDSHDPICRRLASENQAVVVAVDYRLSPEYKFPAAVEDAYDATCWAANHAAALGAAPDKLIVMGDSAGGNLAAVVSLMARNLSRPPIAFQVLIYPATDLSNSYNSKDMYDDTPILSRASMIFYRDQYIRQPEDLKDPDVSPFWADHVGDLPPALVLTAEYDPLRDEGKAYADRLRDAGNDVTYVCYPRMVHGFMSFGRLANASNPAFAQIKQSLQVFSTVSR
jgi:acetyl esterase